MKLYIVSPKFSALFDLQTKFTVIRGDSGTGKSFLCSQVATALDKSSNVDVFCSDAKFKVHLGGDEDNIFDEDLNSYKFVIIYDEDVLENNSKKYKKFLKLKKESKFGYFIVITRCDRAKYIDYGIYDIYDLVYNNKKYEIKRPDTSGSYDGVISKDFIVAVEDTKKGYEFYSNLFEGFYTESIYDEEGNRGKDVLAEYINLQRLRGHSKFLVFVDWCNFGSRYSDLYNMLRLYDLKVVVILNALSFEYVLLNTKLVDYKCEDEYEILKFKHTERYYEVKLSELTQDKPYPVSHDSTAKLPINFKTNHNYWLNGTKFDILLRLSGRK